MTAAARSAPQMKGQGSAKHSVKLGAHTVQIHRSRFAPALVGGLQIRKQVEALGKRSISLGETEPTMDPCCPGSDTKLLHPSIVGFDIVRQLGDLFAFSQLQDPTAIVW